MTYRQLLKGNANFRHLWSGQVVSEIGDWLNNIAVLALALELAGPAYQGRAIAVYAYAGRVFASYETLTTLMMVASMYAAGTGADAFGLRPVAVAGGLTIAFSGLLWFLLRRRQRSGEATSATTNAKHLST